MELLFSGRFRLKNGDRKPFYRCYKFPNCSGTHGAHPNGAPMGIPGDRNTRKIRRRVHAVLNLAFPWSEPRERERTYSWLKDHGFGHIGSMSAEECELVIDVFREEFPTLDIDALVL